MQLSFGRCRFAVVIFVLFLAIKVIDSLHITQVIVPKEILRGSDASIRCTYDLGGDRLYSVKWYKGQHEFFRFVPNELPMFRLFPWSNFSIDYDPQEPGKVHLFAVSSEAEGRYKCEVSTEGPFFDTDYGEENMTVYDVDSQGPVIMTDNHSRLALNEKIKFTCFFQKSRPKATLHWILDGKNIYNTDSRYVQLSESSDWWSVQSEITVTINEEQVRHKGITISCSAVVSSVYRNTTTLNYPPVAVSASIASSRHEKDSSLTSSNIGKRREFACLSMEFFLALLISILLS